MLINMLKVKNLTKYFGGVRALSNLSFEIGGSKVFGIIGPNGSGKTTLFNVIMGIYSPDYGEIEFQGRSIKGLPPHKICRLGITKTHQTPRPFMNLTVLENLLVPLSVQSLKHEYAVDYALKILKLIGLDEVKDTYAGLLLPFQLRKLEIARALACRPKLLLMDEPAAGMRGREIDEMIEIINKIVRDMGVRVVLVDHRMELVAKVAERIMVMHQGTKIFEGDPAEVLNSQVVIQVYLGSGIV